MKILLPAIFGILSACMSVGLSAHAKDGNGPAKTVITIPEALTNYAIGITFNELSDIFEKSELSVMFHTEGPFIFLAPLLGEGLFTDYSANQVRTIRASKEKSEELILRHTIRGKALSIGKHVNLLGETIVVTQGKDQYNVFINGRAALSGIYGTGVDGYTNGDLWKIEGALTPSR